MKLREGPDGPKPRAGPLAALRHRNYRLYWLGQCVSVVGTWMQNLAQAWLVLELTNSPFLLGLVGAAQFAPILLFSLLGGVIVDRVSKRRLVIATQSVMMFTALTLGLLTLTETVQYWHVLSLALVLGLANAVDVPARQSFIVELAGREDLMNAIALHSSVFNGARVVGPAIAGLAIARYGLAACFLINAASFLAVLAGLTLIRVDERPAPRSGRVWPQIAEGLGYVRATPAVFYPLALVALISTFALNFNVLVPVFARTVLEQGAAGFGFLLTAHGVGALAGGLFIAWVSWRGPQVGLLLGGAAGLCAAQIALAPVHAYWAALVLLALAGWMMVVFASTANTTVQLTVPDRLRGRVMSVYSMLFIGVTPFGNLMSGAIARGWGAPAAFAVGAVLGLGSVGLLAHRTLAAARAGAALGAPAPGAEGNAG
ncbi:MAG: MFS transporter [Bacillota bacterium]|nr:MFS transporter [Bacillota bacterium]